LDSPRRCALVTGASSGIGEATARLLASSGYRVAFLARNEERLETLLGDLPGEGHVSLVCDICDPSAVEGALTRLAESFEGLDLLVNNAGIGYRVEVAEHEPELLERLFATNVLGLFHISKAALPLLRRGNLPVVVNVSSVVGRRGIPGMVAYSASKAAVCSLSEGLRVEWAASGIAVCTINPALTATPFFDNQPNPADLPDPDFAAAQTPEEVATEIVALDRAPRPERTLRWKWRVLAVLSVVAPRLSDRMLIRSLGGEWSVPRR
jgi:NAD(P)-dependent dehydrogenase (short-subunit alcohol dehydrogenase family)